MQLHVCLTGHELHYAMRGNKAKVYD